MKVLPQVQRLLPLLRDAATTEDMPLNMGGQNVQLKIIRLHVGHILVFISRHKSCSDRLRPGGDTDR